MIEVMLDLPLAPSDTRIWARNEKGRLFSVTTGRQSDGSHSAAATVSDPWALGVSIVARRDATSEAAFTVDKLDAMMVEAAVEVVGPVELLRMLSAWSETGPRGC